MTDQASAEPPRVVFDCNVYLQAILSRRGPAWACVCLVLDSRLTLITSTEVLSELRSMPAHPALRRFPLLTPSVIETFIAELLSVAVVLDDAPRVFVLPRDPKDAHYVDLAIASRAAIITTRDRDLLDLMTASDPVSIDFRKRFSSIRVLSPADLINLLEPGHVE